MLSLEKALRVFLSSGGQAVAGFGESPTSSEAAILTD